MSSHLLAPLRGGLTCTNAWVSFVRVCRMLRSQSFAALQAQLNKLTDGVRDIEHRLAELHQRFAQDTADVGGHSGQYL